MEALKQILRLVALVYLVVVVAAQVSLTMFLHPLLEKALLGKVMLVDCRHKLPVVMNRKVVEEAQVQPVFLLMIVQEAAMEVQVFLLLFLGLLLLTLAVVVALEILQEVVLVALEAVVMAV